MKNLLYISVSISLIIFSLFTENKAQVQPPKPNEYTIVIHGGAGSMDKTIPDSIKKQYENSLREALKIGQEILSQGGTSVDAVEKVIMFLEDDPKFNAGRGAVYTSDGTFELDASIMKGEDLSCGAVAGVKHIRNPISLARTVMEKSIHVLFTSEGAERFAESQGFKLVDNSYFFTPETMNSWKRYKDKIDKDKKGTVGCVALDKYGNLAAGTSTGGLSGKAPGRVGDSPLINAGTYANNKTCAVSCTGTGELFIRNTVAFNVSALMEYKGMTVKDAASEMIHKRLKQGDGGLIAIDKDGNIAMEFNTPSMLRAAANSEGLFEVSIW
jgi:beta-aspartyl-peptidase (threonine type)